MSRRPSNSQGPGSRLLRGVLIVALGALLAIVIVIVVSFAWPSDATAQVESIPAGNIADLPTSEPVSFFDPDSRTRVWLVRREDGGVSALSTIDSRSGCEIAWLEDFRFEDPRDDVDKAGWFRDPCLGSTYDVNGTFVFGSALRDMDRYPTSVEGEIVHVFVGLSNLISGVDRKDSLP